MNRPIKFRAWDTSWKRWGNDFLLAQTGDFLKVIGEDEDRNMTVDFISNEDKKRYIFAFSTGLLDKNDKEIYGGDVLSDRQSPPRAVKWDDRGAGFIGFNSMVAKFDEIIGNIYENPNFIRDER